MAKLTRMDPSKYLDLNMPPRTLLGPGPSMVDPRVLRVMASPLVGHLDPAFLKLMDQVREMLQAVYLTRNPVTFPVPGTGTAGMETAMANLVEAGDDVLVCAGGYFGERLVEMAGRYRANVRVIRQDWGEAFSPDAVQKALQEQPAKVLAIVHAETSTGVQQPLEQIIPLVHQQGGLVVVDAVTSLGGVPLDVDGLGIDVCYSCSQKCLGCPPGLSPVTVSQRAMDRIASREAPVSNWYLDLSLLQKYWGAERTYHHTAPITAIYGLYEGLRIVLEEGLENRWARHQQHAELLWEGLEDLGLECLVAKENRLAPLTTVRIPDGVDDLAVRSELLEKYHIEIAGGLGELKGKIWRIGLMGYSSRRENVLMLLAALRRILNK